MIDLYRTLGIKRNAKFPVIRKAFRKLSMQHHPDRGGDPERFIEVQLAWRILSDDDRRKRYNDTGFIEDGPDNSQAELVTILSGVFGAACGEIMKNGQDPCSIDIVYHMTATIKKSIQDFKTTLKELSSAEELLKNVASRFTVEDGPNLMENIISGQLQMVKQQRQQTTQRINGHEGALSFMKGVKFKRRKETTGGIDLSFLRGPVIMTMNGRTI